MSKEIDVWSFFRRVLMRGGDIRDLWGKDGYETYVAQIEAAACEEEVRFLEKLQKISSIIAREGDEQ